MKAPQPAYASVVGALAALGVIQYLCVALRGSVCEFAFGGAGRKMALAMNRLGSTQQERRACHEIRR